MSDEYEPSEPPQCDERTTFWPDAEACEAVCCLYMGHTGPHSDLILGGWES